MGTINLLGLILKSSVSILIIWIVWYTFLRRANRFATIRLFLMAGVTISVLLPVIVNVFSTLIPKSVSTITLPIVINLPEVTVSPNGNSLIITWFEMLLAAYLIVGFFFLLRFVVQLSKVGFLLAKGKKTKRFGVTVVEHSKSLPPFSFLGYCFINPNEVPAEKTDLIIQHESAHIKHRHSADIIILELIGFFQWFNPFYWLLKKTVVEVHEFQADQIVLTSKSNQHDYMDSIVSLAFSGIALSLGNNFNKSLTLKRLAMMNSKKQGRYFVPTLLLSFILAFGIVFFISCNKADDFDSNEVVVLKKQNNTNDTKSTNNEEVFIVVEEMPVFDNDKSNDLRKFREYIAKNLKYPESAANNNVQGRVYVTFVVDADGNVKNAHIERGVDAALNNEALRVVKSSPKWKPGRQRGKNVSVKFTFPIVFKLQ